MRGGYGADVKFGVGVVGLFLVFSTCIWNALSECTIHHGCEVVGVDKAKQGVWKQAVYKVHLDRVELRVNKGKTLNREVQWKYQGNNTAGHKHRYRCCFQEILACRDSACGTFAFEALDHVWSKVCLYVCV